MTATGSRWTSELADVRSLIYEAFAATGVPPSSDEVAERLARPRDEVLGHLRELHDLHQIVLTPDSGAIRMAHPFSADPMGFSVRGTSGRTWWGGCAWDSFGIVAALGEPVEVVTNCPACEREWDFEVGPDTPPPNVVVHIPWPARRWWDDVVETCSNIRLCCSDQHATQWAESVDRADGLAVGAERMWKLALDWYGDRLDPGYRPSTPAARQELLASHGFSGPFWRLS